MVILKEYNLEKGSSEKVPFQFIIEPRHLKYNFVDNKSFKRLALFHNNVEFTEINYVPKISQKGSAFFTLERDPSSTDNITTNENFYPHFLFPLIVFSFLEQASLILTSSLLDSLLQQAEDFDPSFSPIFFLQLAYRLSYAILGHNYEEERGKLKIEEIKQRCIIEDYWNSYAEIFPFVVHTNDDDEEVNYEKVRKKVIIFSKEKNIIAILNTNITDYALFCYITKQKNRTDYLEAAQPLFFLYKENKKSEQIIYNYIPDLRANRNNNFQFCAFETHLEIPNFDLGIVVEHIYGKTRTPIIDKRLANLLMTSLLDGYIDLSRDSSNADVIFQRIKKVRRVLIKKDVVFNKLAAFLIKRLALVIEGNDILNKIKTREDAKEIANVIYIEKNKTFLPFHNYIMFLKVLAKAREFELNTIKGNLANDTYSRLYYRYRQFLPVEKMPKENLNDILSDIYTLIKNKNLAFSKNLR